MTALESALHAAMAATLAADDTLPGAALAIDSPRLGIAFEGGIDGPLARADGCPPAKRPFRIASVTKPFTAVAIHGLVADGRLAIVDPIGPHIAPATAEALAGGGYDPQAITIGHLLTHTSGIFDHTETPTYIPAALDEPTRRWTRREQVALAMVEGRPHGAPGQYYRYSDTGYIILGEIVERARGTALAVAVREACGFARLGMKATWWEGAEPPPANASLPAWQYAGALRASDVDASFDGYGGGGLISTVGDLARFIRALIAGQVLDSTLLAGALATPPHAHTADAPPDGRTHSHILATTIAGRHWALGHTGAWGCAMLYVPGHDAALAITLNREGPATMTALRSLIAHVTSLLDDHAA